MSASKILVIDDNENDYLIAKRILKKEGYRVLYEPSGKKGFETVKEKLPDCVLIDRNMPGIDGTEVCKKLTADPEVNHIPKILWTGANAKQDVIDGINAGADDFVTKSADRRLLLVRIKAMLRIKKLQDKKIENLKELKKLNQFKDGLISMLNHDLRSPITTIKGYNYALLNGQLGDITDKQREIFEIQKNSLERMINLINDVLNIKQIEAGRFIIEKETADIMDLIAPLKQELSSRFDKKNINFSIEKDIENTRMEIDPGKVSQVFQNLLQNALKFTPEGGKIKFIIKEVDEDNIEFRVTDTGKGIPEDSLEGIFEAFYTKDDEERDKSSKGVGLGLSICKKIINSHGGTIKAQSEGLGKGSTFIVQLPR
ncbi:MAG: hybrid sensor histidine kinase/response regulator [Elusimicrobiota bacterium]